MRQLVLFLSMVVFGSLSAAAHANSLINNSATGIVTGSIIQDTRGGNNRDSSTVDVGVIEYDPAQGIKNVKVYGKVDGNIVAPLGTHISVGSYYSGSHR